MAEFDRAHASLGGSSNKRRKILSQPDAASGSAWIATSPIDTQPQRYMIEIPAFNLAGTSECLPEEMDELMLDGEAADDAELSSLQQTREHWEFLAEGLLSTVCTYLTQVECIKSVSVVCRRWNRVVRSSKMLWRTLDFNNVSRIPQPQASLDFALAFLGSLQSPSVAALTSARTSNCSSPTDQFVYPIFANREEVASKPRNFVFLEDIDAVEAGMEEDKDGTSEDDDEPDFDDDDQDEEQQFIDNIFDLKQQILSDTCPVERLILPKNCANLHAQAFKSLRKLVPGLKDLVIHPVSAAQQSATAAPTQTPIIATAPGVPAQQQQQQQQNDDQAAHQTAEAARSVLQCIDDQVLRELALFPRLASLKVTGHDAITDSGIEVISKSLGSKLTEISLDYCPRITSAAFRSLVRHCPGLESISMLGNGNCIVGFEDLQHLSSKKLRELRIDVGKTVDGSALQQLTSYEQGCPRLRNLYLRGCQTLDGNSLKILCQGLDYLENLTIVCGRGVRIIAPRIESLSLRSFQLIRCDSLIEPSFSCPNLQSLCIDHCGYLQNPRFTEAHMAMREIRLRNCSLAELDLYTTLLPTGQLSNLKDLEIFDCKVVRGYFGSISSESLEKLCLFKCDGLTGLELRCPRLVSLSVDQCANVIKMHLFCDKLENLQLFAMPQQIQAPRLRELQVKSARLRQLSLQRTACLDSVGFHCEELDTLNLSGCKKLRNVNMLYCPKLDKLALGGSEFDYSLSNTSSQKLFCGAAASQITMLSIGGSISLSDAQLQDIVSRLPRLQALIIESCNALCSPVLLGAGAAGLHGIQLNDCTSLQSLQVQSVHLAKLYLSNCPCVSDQTLQQITERCPSVRIIEMQQCPGIKTPFLNAQHLTDLRFKQCANLRCPILQCPSLNKLLFLSCGALTGMSLVGECRQAAEVLFSECPNVHDDVMTCLENGFPNLQAIVFSKCHGLQQPEVSGFEQLKVLRFGECDRLVCPRLTEKSCSSIKLLSFQSCKSLQTRSLNKIWSALNAEKVEFSFCDRLQQLNFEACVASISIQNCNMLQQIRLMHSGIRQVSIQHCASLQSVEFDAVATGVQDIAVSSCRALGRFEFKTHALNAAKSLSLQACPMINDEAIHNLLYRLPTIQSLTLGSCGISRLALCLPGLRNLSLQQLPRLVYMQLCCDRLTSMAISSCPNLLPLTTEQFHVQGKTSCLSQSTLANLERITLGHIELTESLMRTIVFMLTRSTGPLRDVELLHCRGVDAAATSSGAYGSMS